MPVDEWGEWAEIVRLLRGYALRKYGDDVEAIKLKLRHRGETLEYIPVQPQPPAEVGPPARPAAPLPRAAAAGQGAGARPPPSGSAIPWHSSDWRLVDWPGLGRFTFSRLQGRVISALWDAHREGAPAVRQEDLLRVVDSQSPRLGDLFRGHPAWGTLIVRGPGPSTYRLAELPAVEGQGGEDAENFFGDE